MPSRSDTAPARNDTAPARSDTPGSDTERLTRLVLTADGPVLVSGPVELELPDGSRVTSGRPMTAVCTCRRSRRYPFCDASHRLSPETAPVVDAAQENRAGRENR